MERPTAPSNDDHPICASAANVFTGGRKLGRTRQVGFKRTSRVGRYVDLAGGYMGFEGVNSWRSRGVFYKNEVRWIELK